MIGRVRGGLFRGDVARHEVYWIRAGPAPGLGWHESIRVEVTQLAGDQNGNTVAAASTTRAIETWTYNFSTSSFLRRLVIKDGVVARVQTGGFGYGQ